MLLRCCNVTEEVGDVAPVWRRLAKCQKSEQHTLLTQELQKVCVSRGLSTQLYAPIVTMTLKQMIVGLQFPRYSPDDLGTGCQPFLVLYARNAHHLQVTSASAVADQLAQGDQNATLADIRSIREGEKLKFPLNLTGVCVTLYTYAVLCQTLFQGTGDKHPFVETLWKVAAGLKDIEPSVTDKYNEIAGPHNLKSLYYSPIVRAVQIWSHEYLHRVATTNEENSIAGVPVPTFDHMLIDLTRGTFHNSTNWIDLPAEYLRAASTTTRTPMSVVASPGTASTAPSTTGGPSISGGRSTVSSLTGGTTPVKTRISVSRVNSVCWNLSLALSFNSESSIEHLFSPDESFKSRMMSSRCAT